MPFSRTDSTENWDEVYNNVIKTVIEESGFNYECKRSGPQTGSFTKEIIENLRYSFLVVADITDLNPNVMWELGVRHSLSKRTIMIAKKEVISKIPSDITNYVVIPYESDITSYREFKDKIKEVLELIDKNPERKDSPVFDFLSEEEMIRSKINQTEKYAKLAGLMSELSANLKLAELIKSNKFGVTVNRLTLHRFHTSALDEILVNNYVTVSDGLQNNLYDVRNLSQIMNKRMDLISLEKRVQAGSTEQSKKIKKGLPRYIKLCKKIMGESFKVGDLIKSGTVQDALPKILIFSDNHPKIFEGESAEQTNNNV